MSIRLLLLSLVGLCGVTALAFAVVWWILDWLTREMFEDIRRSIGSE